MRQLGFNTLNKYLVLDFGTIFTGGVERANNS